MSRVLMRLPPPPTTEVVDDGETSDASGPIDASGTVPESQKLEGTEEGHANTVESMTVTMDEGNANKVEETSDVVRTMIPFVIY